MTSINRKALTVFLMLSRDILCLSYSTESLLQLHINNSFPVDTELYKIGINSFRSDTLNNSVFTSRSTTELMDVGENSNKITNKLDLANRDDYEDVNKIYYLGNGSYYENTSLPKYSDEYLMENYLDFVYPKSWTWILIFFHFLVFVIGLVGNGLVCIAVYRNHTMRTVTNYFIVNLAVADGLVILFCLPFSVVWDVTSTWWFGSAMCKIVLYIQSASVTVSILTLAFISMDRWYAICFPLKFKSTTGRAKTAIGIIWIVALACEIPEPIYLTALPYGDSFIYFTQCTVTWSKQTDTLFVVVKMVLFYISPLLLMCIAYIQIIRVLWKSPHQVIDVSGQNRSGHVNTFAMNMNASTEGQLRSRRKAAKMLVAVVVMFAFCFLPVHLLSVLRLTVKLTNSEVNRAFSLISHWLCYANSAVNPIIYNIMSGKFRKEFRRAFHHCCQRGGSGLNYRYGDTSSHGTKDENASRTQSVTNFECYRLKPYKEFEEEQTRKFMDTSILEDI